jgi:predicted phosphohydrolase
MKQVLWGTDLHLNFLDDADINSFLTGYKRLIEENESKGIETSSVIITGDSSEAQQLVSHLSMIQNTLELPVYFVCGNHDYWGSSFKTMRDNLIALPDDLKIKWMGSTDYVPLFESHALVGHDGWYDAVLGDWRSSQFMMNDWIRIAEFIHRRGDSLISNFRELSLESALHVVAGANKAIQDGFKQIVVITHIPPFADVAAFRGRPTEPSALPWYTSGLMGDKLMNLANENPDIEFTVLAGHTHENMSKKMLPNLIVHVGGAKYGSPAFRQVTLVSPDGR